MSYRFKVALAGDERVGKTASIRRFIDGSFSDSYKQTLGVEVTVKVIQIGHVTVIFSIFDVAAQPTYKVFRANYYAGARGFFLLFDQTDHGTTKPVAACSVAYSWNRRRNAARSTRPG